MVKFISPKVKFEDKEAERKQRYALHKMIEERDAREELIDKINRASYCPKHHIKLTARGFCPCCE